MAARGAQHTSDGITQMLLTATGQAQTLFAMGFLGLVAIAGMVLLIATMTRHRLEQRTWLGDLAGA